METAVFADGTVESFRAAAKEFDAVYAQFARNCDLSEAEYWSLLMIRNGFKTQAEISDRIFISRQTINSAFKLLVKKGLVKLEPLENNQRTKRITLTEAGEQFAAHYIDGMREIEQRAWLSMEENERVLLTQLTRKYCGLIQQVMQQNVTMGPSTSEYLSSQGPDQ